jgi:glycoside/pentoside/hexuronide:cation symporter, GPH family
VVGAQQLLLVIAGIGLCLDRCGSYCADSNLYCPGWIRLSGPQTLTNVLFAQVADEDEVRSGVRREGSFFGVNALLTKPAQSVALALSPFILEATQFVTRESNAGDRPSWTSLLQPFLE